MFLKFDKVCYCSKTISAKVSKIFCLINNTLRNNDKEDSEFNLVSIILIKNYNL